MRIFTITLTLGFVWLANFSYHHRMSETAGYSPHEIDEVNNLVARSSPLPPLAFRQAKAIKYIYGITGEEIASDIWGK